MGADLGNMEFYYSGGESNQRLSRCFGGAVSSHPLRFSNVGPLEQASGPSGPWSPASTIVPFFSVVDIWNLHETQEAVEEEWESVYLRYSYSAYVISFYIEYRRVGGSFTFVTDPVEVEIVDAGRYLVPLLALNPSEEYYETQATLVIDVPSMDPLDFDEIGDELGRWAVNSYGSRINPLRLPDRTLGVALPAYAFTCIYYKNIGDTPVSFAIGLSEVDDFAQATIGVGVELAGTQKVSSSYVAPAGIAFMPPGELVAFTVAPGEHLAIWFRSVAEEGILPDLYTLVAKLEVRT